jgi:hypothetical protein
LAWSNITYAVRKETIKKLNRTDKQFPPNPPQCPLQSLINLSQPMIAIGTDDIYSFWTVQEPQIGTNAQLLPMSA